MSYFQVLSIFISFLLGLASTSIVERLKIKTNSKLIYKNFKTEIKEEEEQLIKKLTKMAATLANLYKLKNISFYSDEELESINGPVKYIPQGQHLYFLNPAIEKSFTIMSKKQRYIAKILISQTKSIDFILNSISNSGRPSDNIDEAIINCKKYLTIGALHLYNIRLFIENKEPHAIPETFDTKEIINNIFSKLKINLSYDDIQTKRTEIIKEQY